MEYIRMFVMKFSFHIYFNIEIKRKIIFIMFTVMTIFYKCFAKEKTVNNFLYILLRIIVYFCS